MSAVLLVLVSFALMEPVAYCLHRWVMHSDGRGGRWHRSHHQARVAPLEQNDWYPVVLAAVTVLVMAVGASAGTLRPLLWVGTGVTAYGAAYLFVHDVYIHRRLRWFTWRWAPLERVREAHRIHHLWAGEPYGFLFPVVPAALRARALTVARDPLLPAAPG